jgi:lipopolysaccharide export system protein LptC
MAVLAGFTWWLLQAVQPREKEAPPRPLTHTPDYFADQFSVSELDQTGATQYRLTATHMVHYEDDSNSDLTKPAVRAFQPGKPIVTATGDRGTVNSDASIVDLYDNARIVRAAGYGDPEMQADSEHFHVRVNDDVIETEKPVKLRRGQSVMTATDGMNYNNVTRVIQLHGNVRGAIAPADSGGSS